MEALPGVRLASWPPVRKKERKPVASLAQRFVPAEPGGLPAQPLLSPTPSQRQEHEQKEAVKIRKSEDGKFQGRLTPRSFFP